jgi:hypothetical protein
VTPTPAIARPFLLCLAAQGGDVAPDAQAPPPAPPPTVDAGSAAATGASPAPFDPHGFSLDFRPQVWLPSVNGTVGVHGTNVNVDASFTDILQSSDSLVGLSGRLTLTYDRFEAYTDTTWLHLGFDNATTPSGAHFNTTMALMISDVCFAYNLLEPSVADGWRVGPKLAPYAGARIFWANTEVQAPNGPGSDSASAVWADPIVGGMWDTPFSDAWRFSIAGDIGGFSANSQLTWQATAMLGLDFPCFGNPSTFSVGIRAIADNYSTGGAKDLTVDAIFWGPILAWAIRF